MEIRIELPDVKLGVVEADDVRFALVDEGLAKLMDQVCERKRREFTLESLAEAEPTRAVRAMFRAWGVDPSKYRPSSEALLRRVVQGKGLYRVSNLVDIGNLGSIETGWPYGCYDRSRLDAAQSYSATARRTNSTRASASARGTSKAGRSSPTRRDLSAAPSATLRAA